MIKFTDQKKSTSEMLELNLFYMNQFCELINPTGQCLDCKEA